MATASHAVVGSTRMERVRFVNHKGKQILLVDLTDSDPAQGFWIRSNFVSDPIQQYPFRDIRSDKLHGPMRTS